jgi:protein O-GlcNAc transferase
MSHSQVDPDTASAASAAGTKVGEQKIVKLLERAQGRFDLGQYIEAQEVCDQVYEQDAFRTDNLLMLGAIHFQLSNYSESIFYNQQCIRVDPSFAEAYSNLGNALKELGDVAAAVQFYNKSIKLKPRYPDAYNNLACAYMQIGELQQAMETYQMALVLNPTLVDAHSNLGNLCKAQGDLDSAKKCYLEAIRIKPDFAIAWSNLAGVFKDEGQLATAVAYLKEAVRLSPEFADAHSNLGNALKEMGEADDAIAAYKTAIKLRPDFAIAHGNLASCFYDKKELKEAVRLLKYAIQLEPNYPDAYNNLGNAFKELGHLDDAVNAYRSCLRLKQDHPHAYNNLGNAMKDKGLTKESIHCYVTAIRLMPHFAAAHSNLGTILKEQGKVDQALSHYHEAIAIEPLFAEAYSNLGNVYKSMDKFEEASKCFSTAIRLRPDFAEAHANMGFCLQDQGLLFKAIEALNTALEIRPDYPDAFANLVRAKQEVCDWSSWEEDQARLGQVVQEQLVTSSEGTMALGLLPLPAVQPLYSLASTLSLSELQQLARRYAAKAKLNVSLVETHYRFTPRSKSARIKIGYVSSNFGNHPVAHLIQSVFNMHDRSRFEVFCYATSSGDESHWRRKIETEAESFKDVSQLHAGDTAQLIQNDGIHILVNLNGYTKGATNEVFALRPCLLQVSLMGFSGTTGADYIDYLVADKTVIPEENRRYYSERMLYMPHCSYFNDYKQSSRFVLDRTRSPPPPSRQLYGLSEDKFVFCNFSQAFKIDPLVFRTWMSILKRVPNSVLWLLRFPDNAEQNLLDEAKLQGVREDQLHFTDVVPKEEHLARGYLADLFLDTPLYNAQTTACDILWSGTPMLTLEGDKMAARTASSILRAISLEELCTSSVTDYEELAVALATDSDRLFAIRRKLENSRDSSALFDTQRWVQNFEKGLEEAIRRQDSGLAPDDITVTDSGPVAEEKEQEILFA